MFSSNITEVMNPTFTHFVTLYILTRKALLSFRKGWMSLDVTFIQLQRYCNLCVVVAVRICVYNVASGTISTLWYRQVALSMYTHADSYWFQHTDTVKLLTFAPPVSRYVGRCMQKKNLTVLPFSLSVILLVECMGSFRTDMSVTRGFFFTGACINYII